MIVSVVMTGTFALKVLREGIFTANHIIQTVEEQTINISLVYVYDDDDIIPAS